MTTRPSAGSRFVQVILVIAVIVLATAWWRQRENLREARRENERLARTATATRPDTDILDKRSAPEPDAPLPATPVGSDQASEPQAPRAAPMDRVMSPAGMTPAPRSSGLVLEGTRVEPVTEGLVTTLRFTPVDTSPLGVVAIVFRLSRETPDRILGLKSGGAAALEDVMTRVSEDGKFAIVHGTTEQAAAIEFALTVSGATTADVRGTCGIGPFDLGISAEGVVVSPK